MSCSDKYTPIHYMISNKNLSCNKVALHLSSVGVAGVSRICLDSLTVATTV